MSKTLVFTGISGSRVGQQALFSMRSCLIGSTQGCDLVIHDRHVLPRHAEIRQVLDRWFIVSLDKGALIFVNGIPVQSQQRIDEGDLVTVGTATFKVDIQAMREFGR